jgi:aryl-alcohol dehydrogenase-like predicted oxidoreductase
MEYRELGKTGLRVSALGFGCGNVGGLMIRGSATERERAVARAVELGINYFDTAPSYGDGQSEQNLGVALRSLHASVHVGTKFRLDAADLGAVRASVGRSLDASLKRLGRDSVDLLQLHNNIFAERGGEPVSVADVLDQVIPALQELQAQGKTRFWGITALGEPAALHRVLDTASLHTAQVCYNLLNPSAGVEVMPGFPPPDFRRLLVRAEERRVGAIVIRVLAAGALSGTEERHPLGSPPPAPIGSGSDYRRDVERARRFEPLVREGHADSLIEATLRYVIAHPAVSTVLVGYSTMDHLEYAARAIEKGPLSAAALVRVAEIQRGFAGEPR